MRGIVVVHGGRRTSKEYTVDLNALPRIGEEVEIDGITYTVARIVHPFDTLPNMPEDVPGHLTKLGKDILIHVSRNGR